MAVIDRPDWNKIMAECGGAQSDDNERVIITRGTARLAKSAIRHSQEEEYYHNFDHAERELIAALARPTTTAQQKIANLNASLAECEHFCATQAGALECNCGGWYFRTPRMRAAFTGKPMP